jgi:hypothetical protein
MTLAPCCCPLQANYNNCSEVDLESVDESEVGADDSVDTDRAAPSKRAREVPSSADTTAELTLDNASSSIPSSGTAATPTAPAVATLMEALNIATHSISTVVERLAEIAKKSPLSESTVRHHTLLLKTHLCHTQAVLIVSTMNT